MSTENKKTIIFPMAFIPKMNTTFKLYFVGFPSDWKKGILEIHSRYNPLFNVNYNMYTNTLYGYLNGWHDEIIYIKPMQKDSDDSHWLVLASKPDLSRICEILRIWIASEYIDNSNCSEEIKSMAHNLIELIEPSVLEKHVQYEDTILFNSNGKAVTDYAYKAFAMYAANAVIGKEITFGSKTMTMCACGADELVSRPIYHLDEAYSIVIKFSVQTTPPERKCMLLVQCSVRRYISKIWKKKPFLNKKIHALVKTGEYKYRRIAIGYNKSAGECDWTSPEKKCYNMYNLNALPAVQDVFDDPANYFSNEPQILLPYSNNIDFANKSKIGTGVSVVDKSNIYNRIKSLLSDFAEDVGEVASAFRADHIEKQRKFSEENRRSRLAQCISKKRLDIEVYGYDNDKEIYEAIRGKILEHFGDNNEYKNIIDINISFHDLGDLGSAMLNNNYEGTIERIDKISDHIPKAMELTGSIIILPDKDNYSTAGDPKNALRAGFADTNRLTQFITPYSEDEKETAQEHRIDAAIMDLLRQFGYTKEVSTQRAEKNKIYSTDVIGIHLFKQLEPLYGRGSKDRARFLPVYITYNFANGQVFADCDLFENRHIPYGEALILLSKLSRSADFVKKCNDALRNGIKNKMLGYKNLYRNKDALILVHATGDTRTIWPGISDKCISEYDYISDYCPKEIDIGTNKVKHFTDFTDTGVRIMRLRFNQGIGEVPDYFTKPKTEPDSGFVSSQGIFKYNQVYWAVEGRPKDIEYMSSYANSRSENPTQSFNERGLVEIYPIQIQTGDKVDEWVKYTNLLREPMPEYKGNALKLPAPLQFAKLMEEYILIK